MTDEQIAAAAERECRKAKEHLAELVADALAAAFKRATMKDASDRLREELFNAVRFEV
jgi:hypothetical protein